jgi:TPR repeat protein
MAKPALANVRRHACLKSADAEGMAQAAWRGAAARDLAQHFYKEGRGVPQNFTKAREWCL